MYALSAERWVAVEGWTGGQEFGNVVQVVVVCLFRSALVLSHRLSASSAAA